MLATLRRIGRDIKHLRNLEAYVVALLALVFAVLTIVGDVVPDDIRWAALLAGVGLLVYRLTVTESPENQVDDLLLDRSALDEHLLSDRFRAAREVWIFGPSAVNVLSVRNCELLRKGPLSNSDGIVRIVVLDPEDDAAIQLATRQLDDSLEFPLQEFRRGLETTLGQLRSLASWKVEGDFDYRLLDYNPGFSMVAIDPRTRHGLVIVEFHAFHNETTLTRMHLELTSRLSERWYRYWTGQFDAIWRSARLARAAADTGNDQSEGS